MVKLGFFSLMLIMSYIVTRDIYTLVTIIAATIHELGHVFAAAALKIRIGEFKLGVLGARLRVSDGIYSYSKEAILCAAGPFINFLTALFAFLLFPKNEIMTIFIFISIGLGILNLLPIRSFDGGRIFEALLLRALVPDIAKKILDCLSFFIVLFLWLVSVYFLLKYSSSLNLFIFSSSLFCGLFVDKEF